MLILAKPAEDEFALGFLGRLTHLNLHNSGAEFIKKLLRTHRHSEARGEKFRVLARAAGMSTRDFYFAHTLTPAVVGRYIYYRGTSHRKDVWTNTRNPLTPSSEYAHFCNDCLAEQRHNIGFGYWHRVHQLPGIYWCPTHRKPLTRANTRVIPNGLPSNNLPTLNITVPVFDAIRNPILSRYSEVIIKFLRSPFLICEYRLNCVLQERAKAIGINTEDLPSDKPFLSDIVFDCIPTWWLNGFLDTAKKRRGEYFYGIDAVLIPGNYPSTHAFTLAIALMYENLEEFNIASVQLD